MYASAKVQIKLLTVALKPNNIVHKAASSFVTYRSKKLPARMPPRGCSCQWLPLTANGHFSVPQEMYQWKSWNVREHETGSFVNCPAKKSYQKKQHDARDGHKIRHILVMITKYLGH